MELLSSRDLPDNLVNVFYNLNQLNESSLSSSSVCQCDTYPLPLLAQKPSDSQSSEIYLD